MAIFHVRDYPPYSFGFESFDGNMKPKPEPPCLDPDGHMFEEQSFILLSYPPQHVWHCIHDNCGVVRHVAEPLPELRRSRDPR